MGNISNRKKLERIKKEVTILKPTDVDYSGHFTEKEMTQFKADHKKLEKDEMIIKNNTYDTHSKGCDTKKEIEDMNGLENIDINKNMFGTEALITPSNNNPNYGDSNSSFSKYSSPPIAIPGTGQPGGSNNANTPTAYTLPNTGGYKPMPTGAPTNTGGYAPQTAQPAAGGYTQQAPQTGYPAITPPTAEQLARIKELGLTPPNTGAISNTGFTPTPTPNINTPPNSGQVGNDSPNWRTNNNQQNGAIIMGQLPEGVGNTTEYINSINNPQEPSSVLRAHTKTPYVPVYTQNNAGEYIKFSSEVINDMMNCVNRGRDKILATIYTSNQPLAYDFETLINQINNKESINMHFLSSVLSLMIFRVPTLDIELKQIISILLLSGVNESEINNINTLVNGVSAASGVDRKPTNVMSEIRVVPSNLNIDFTNPKTIAIMAGIRSSLEPLHMLGVSDSALHTDLLHLLDDIARGVIPGNANHVFGGVINALSAKNAGIARLMHDLNEASNGSLISHDVSDSKLYDPASAGFRARGEAVANVISNSVVTPLTPMHNLDINKNTGGDKMNFYQPTQQPNYNQGGYAQQPAYAAQPAYNPVYTQPLQPSYNQGGYNNNMILPNQGGYAQPMPTNGYNQGGYAQPQNGYANQGGYAQNTGAPNPYAQPQNGYAQNPQPNYNQGRYPQQPAYNQGGYAPNPYAPQNPGYAQGGYNMSSPNQGGYAQNAPMYNQPNYNQPRPNQGGYAQPQNGYANQGGNFYQPAPQPYQANAYSQNPQPAYNQGGYAQPQNGYANQGGYAQNTGAPNPYAQPQNGYGNQSNTNSYFVNPNMNGNRFANTSPYNTANNVSKGGL